MLNTGKRQKAAKSVAKTGGADFMQKSKLNSQSRSESCSKSESKSKPQRQPKRQSKSKWDILIKNGRVVDGTGNPSSNFDIAVKDGKIERVDRSLRGDAQVVIDASGSIVSPGFVDLHNHTEMAALAYPQCESHIMQGITTSVVGNCGLAMAPINPEKLHLLKQYVGPFLPDGFDWGWDWLSLDDYCRKLERQGISMNMAPLAGQGSIRLAVRGFDSDESTPEQIEEMKQLLRDSLEQGAWGMSAGLIYPPGCYANMSEMIELAKVVADYGGIYATHLRNEGDRLMDAVQEAITIGRESGARVEISHHKVLGKHNWGKVNATLREMERAREQGVNVSCDCYPYKACSTTLTACMPPWTMTGGVKAMLERLRDPELRKRIAREIEDNSVEMENMIKGSGWEGIVIASCPANHGFDGKSMTEILPGRYETSDMYQAFLDFMLEIDGEASMIAFAMDEADVATVIAHPLTSVVTDAWLTKAEAQERPHPRSYGSMPRLIRRYVVEDKVLSLEDAIRKMTSLSASVVGLPNRGLIREGFAGDLVVFDLNKIRDAATFQVPNRYPEGIEYVIVNGVVTVDHGRHTGALNGRVLRKRR